MLDQVPLLPRPPVFDVVNGVLLMSASAATAATGPLPTAAAWMPSRFDGALRRNPPVDSRGAARPPARITWCEDLPCAEVVAAPGRHVLVWCGYPREQLRALRRLVGRCGRVLHVWGVATSADRTQAWALVREFLIIRIVWCESPPVTARPVPHWHRPQIVMR